jgi:hypothetical protein
MLAPKITLLLVLAISCAPSPEEVKKEEDQVRYQSEKFASDLGITSKNCVISFKDISHCSVVLVDKDGSRPATYYCTPYYCWWAN